jgi:hypothetical protein
MKKGVVKMKKVVFKKWLNNLLVGVAMTTFILIASTIDNEWTTQYLQFLSVNGGLCLASALLLAKWGRQVEED